MSDFQENVPFWARRLQELTARSGLSQAELARRAGMNRDAFNRYHSGRTRPPGARLEALAEVFSVHPNDIDPDRLTLVKRGVEKTVVPYSITPSASGDPKLVHLKVDTDVTMDAMTKILDILTVGVRSAERSSGEG